MRFDSETRAHHWLREPLAIILGFCGFLYAGFGFLPPIRHEEPPPRNPKSRRGRP